MSAFASPLVRTFKVGAYECTLTFPPANRGAVSAMSAEWSPQHPGCLTPAEFEQYRTGRNKALAELAAIVGGNVAVVE